MPSAPALTVTPIESSAGFGAFLDGVDINNLSEHEFKELERALYTHKLLVIRGQPNLDPKKQFELVQRFDPTAKPVHGHGSASQVAQKASEQKNKRNLVGANPGVPAEPMVRMIGRATLPVGYHGATEEITLTSGTHKGFHKEPLSDEEIDSGLSRFHRWHIDAALYKVHPPKVTALWAHKLPTGPPITVQWDVSSPSPQSMTAQPGLTAFLDSSAMYASLSDEDKAWVDHSEVEYAPSPYLWIQDSKATDDGFGLVSEGRETPLEELPPVDESAIKRYKMIWPNPLTGAPSLQVHSIVARRLFLRRSPTEDFQVIDDVAEVRDMLYKLQKPFLRPENILVTPQGEGDLCLWHNRSLRHTAIEYPQHTYGDRIMHQVHVAGSDDPGNPVMLEQAA
ncbi:hypothetical protein JCM6882_000072 [Rhodosporidiobolus microsporus]